MDMFFKYLPFLMKLSEHRAEIERIQVLAAPAVVEFKKVWPEVAPLLQKLGQLLAPTLSELRKVWSELWPLVMKLASGLSK